MFIAFSVRLAHAGERGCSAGNPKWLTGYFGSGLVARNEGGFAVPAQFPEKRFPVGRHISWRDTAWLSGRIWQEMATPTLARLVTQRGVGNVG